MHGDALRGAGADWLTGACHAFGSLPRDNSISRIVRLDPCPGGSTGQKFFLSVEYARLAPGLHRDLFVKFSRDFTDPLRDHGRHEMEAEVRLAALSHLPGFPISVPAAYVAGYHQPSGSGILITQRIAFGRGGIEPHHAKCLDHQLSDPLSYYQAIVKARSAAACSTGGGSVR